MIYGDDRELFAYVIWHIPIDRDCGLEKSKKEKFPIIKTLQYHTHAHTHTHVEGLHNDVLTGKEIKETPNTPRKQKTIKPEEEEKIKWTVTWKIT